MEQIAALFRRNIYGLMQLFSLHVPAINGYQKMLSLGRAKSVCRKVAWMHARPEFISFFNAFMLLWLQDFVEQCFRPWIFFGHHLTFGRSLIAESIFATSFPLTDSNSLLNFPSLVCYFTVFPLFVSFFERGPAHSIAAICAHNFYMERHKAIRNLKKRCEWHC